MTLSIHRNPWSGAALTMCIAAAGAAAGESPPQDSTAASNDTVAPHDLPVIEASVTVRSALGKEQRLLDAPVPMSVITSSQIELEGGASSLPKLLDSLPALEGTQAGLFDFKLNTRGLNTAANRRLAVSIDGRDPSFPLIDSQEWATVMFSADTLEQVELIRGPSSAVYGTNAFNGVLSLVTRSARDSLGGGVRLTGGENDTQRLELSLATALGAGWFFKGTGSYLESDDFYRSRNVSPEYSRFCGAGESVDCLLQEATPLPLDRSKVSYFGARFEKNWGSKVDGTFEGGGGSSEGTMFGAATSRFQALDVERPWARFALTGNRFEVSGNYTGREAELWTLLAGSASYSDSRQYEVEALTRSGFAANRGYWALGATWARDELSTAGPSGRETLLAAPIDQDTSALYGHLDFDLHKKLSLQAAVRWDDNPLYGTAFSPHVSLVWAPTTQQTVRLGYREGFLTPSYPEYFVRSPLAPPLDLSAFEEFCRPSGITCGFDTPVPLLGVGNAHLEPETVAAFEVGYSAVLGKRSFLQATYYRSEAEDFIQTSAPLVGSALGRANPDFGPYAPPSGLDPETADALRTSLAGALGTLFPFLTNPNGSEPILALITVANSGQVDVQGLEVSLDSQIHRKVAFSVSYSWFDLQADDPLPGLQPIAGNAPEHSAKASLRYEGTRWSASLRYRWSDAFRWFEVLLNGPVMSYDVVDISTRFEIDNSWSLGIQASNVLDESHYEFFSGDLLNRQVLLHVDLKW